MKLDKLIIFVLQNAKKKYSISPGTDVGCFFSLEIKTIKSD